VAILQIEYDIINNN